MRVQKQKFYKEMAKKGLTKVNMSNEGIMYTLTNSEILYINFNKKRKSFYKV